MMAKTWRRRRGARMTNGSGVWALSDGFVIEVTEASLLMHLCFYTGSISASCVF